MRWTIVFTSPPRSLTGQEGVALLLIYKIELRLIRKPTLSLSAFLVKCVGSFGDKKCSFYSDPSTLTILLYTPIISIGAAHCPTNRA